MQTSDLGRLRLRGLVIKQVVMTSKDEVLRWAKREQTLHSGLSDGFSRVAHTCRFLACVRSGEPVQGEDGDVLEEVEAKAGPRLQVRGGDQLALDRIVMHVIQFLPAF